MDCVVPYAEGLTHSPTSAARQRCRARQAASDSAVDMADYSALKQDTEECGGLKRPPVENVLWATSTFCLTFTGPSTTVVRSRSVYRSTYNYKHYLIKANRLPRS